MVLVHDDDLGLIRGIGDDTVSQRAYLSFAFGLTLSRQQTLETLHGDVVKDHLRSLKPEIQQVLYGGNLLNLGFMDSRRPCSQTQDRTSSDESGPDTDTTAIRVAMLSNESQESKFRFFLSH